MDVGARKEAVIKVINVFVVVIVRMIAWVVVE